MMQTIPATITPNSVSLLIDGRMRTVPRGAANFDAVKYLLKMISTSPEDETLVPKLKDLVDIPSFVERASEGRVKVGDGVVLYDGKEVKGVLVDRLLTLLREGHDIRPLARFLDRVKQNPLLSAQDEIYLWLESGNLPITDDGCFIAFKKVCSDFSSSHRLPDGSKLFNRPGDTPTMKREDVDANRNNTCSRGLHFCSWQYLPQFGVGGEAKVVTLKVAPEDVVSIPYDYNNSKGRAWRYLVLGEVPADECEHLFRNTPVVTNHGLYDNRDEVEDEDDTGYDYHDDEDNEIDGTDCDDHCGEDNCDVCDHRDDADDDTIGCCAAQSDDEHDDDDVEVEAEPEARIELVFKRGRRKWTADELKAAVADWGQRGFAKRYKVPRTTVQSWLKQIDAHSV